MDSIKGAIILRARLEEAGVAAPPPPPTPHAGALPLFHWVSTAGETKAAPEGGFDALERT